MKVAKLSSQQESELLRHAADGRMHVSAGAFVDAERAFLDAWAVIPEPKLEFDYAQNIAAGLVSFYRDTGQYAKAEEWLKPTADSYGHDNPHVVFLRGTVSYCSGALDEAYRDFDAVYQLLGKRAFAGRDRRYLEFYRARSGRRP